ncbi:MAG: hypothetical protein J2P17_23480 [Mycobacterium sp.]|nr:hypothetical protein [Mycobacterium sp.]
MSIDTTCDDRVKGLASVTCVAVTCTICGGRFEDSEGWNPHFSSAAEALEEIRESDWQIGPDGVRCEHCANKATCAAEGHRWDAWGPCLCGGRTHHTTRMEIRVCRRCGAMEERPDAASSADTCVSYMWDPSATAQRRDLPTHAKETPATLRGREC